MLAGLPGADGDAGPVYDVITSLADRFAYFVSRTPGQPFLDYLNFVFWSMGGERAVQLWYVVVSCSGIVFLYQLAVDLKGSQPLAAALALALHPLFLGHVGGLGDFAVSVSFLAGALALAQRRRPVAAGMLLACAIGCRLAFCVYVIPVMALAFTAYRQCGASTRNSLVKSSQLGAVAALVAAAFYAPLLSFLGWGLLENLPFQGLAYHLSAGLYRLFVSLGVFFWAAMGVAIIRVLRRRFRPNNSARSQWSDLDWILGGIAVLGAITLFRVPTKEELVLPILLAVILIVQRRANARWAWALVAASLIVGMVRISPYEPQDGQYKLVVGPASYWKMMADAHANRYAMREIEAALYSHQQQPCIVIYRSPWTEFQEQGSDVVRVPDYRGISGLTAYTFRHLRPDCVAVHHQVNHLADLLQSISAAPPDVRPRLYYEADLRGAVKRWMHVDLQEFGEAIEFHRSPLSELLGSFGESSRSVAVMPPQRAASLQ